MKPTITLWLDDTRPPWKYGYLGAEWVKTADEAIALLRTGRVKFASLDHDLHDEHYVNAGDPNSFKEKTGMAVVEWMEQTNTWPPNGVAVHSMNPVGRERMQAVIDRHYSKRR